MNYKITFTQDSPVLLPGMGMCTGTVSFFPGDSGSYWEPPEEPGIEEAQLKDAYGNDLDPEMILENEEVYAALESAISSVLETEYREEAEAMSNAYNEEVPF